MCGFFGTLNYPVDNPVAVFQGLQHRGPDEQGVVQTGSFTLLHTRLAIQDTGAGGRQPMQSDRWILAFNGEIYNHHDLRLQYGLTCRSGSDTETLLHLWEKLGAAMLPELDGMYALAVFDRYMQQLWLARDRFGEKPLYIWQDGIRLVFSSELRVLQEQLPLSINRRSLSRFCQFGYFVSTDTPFENVRLVRPGHVETIQNQTCTATGTCWWKPRFRAVNPSLSMETTRCNLDTVLNESVRRRLDTTDREVGVLLSGGIDSGLVTAMAARHRSGVRTFTLSAGPNRFDEAPLARIVARQYGTLHTEVLVPTHNLADQVLTILPRYGEPFMDSSALPGYWVAQAARQQVTVVLTGDGADELFGGYRRYVAARLGTPNLPVQIVRLIGIAHRCLPYPGQRSRYSYIYRLGALLQRSGVGRYLAATTDLWSGYESALAEPVSLAELDEWIGQIASLSELQQAQVMDLSLLFPGDLLKKMDIATMAHSLEARNPFLANEVAQLALTLPDSMKIGWDGAIQTKLLLRRLAGNYLPDSVIRQPKRGFEVPLSDWVEGPLRSLVYDYLTRPQLIDSLVRPHFVRQLLARPDQFPGLQRARLLWMMLSVEIWYRSLAQHD